MPGAFLTSRTREIESWAKDLLQTSIYLAFLNTKHVSEPYLFEPFGDGHGLLSDFFPRVNKERRREKTGSLCDGGSIMVLENCN